MYSGTAELRCFCLTGPTASGKTALALELADRFDAEIVSMDSAMVYRGMDIGTDKPDAATRARIRHHLIDIRDPEENYSAGAFTNDAVDAIRGAAARGAPVIVAGGTLLYLRALREGLADLPARDPTVRADIDALARAKGWAALHAELARIDPGSAARIGPGDRQRIQRALEVYRITGRTMTALQAEARQRPNIRIPTVALVPQDRESMRRRITVRFDEMIDSGFVDEVRRLRARPGLSAGSQSMRSVGYRQLWAWLATGGDWETARERAIIATRQLAKRQLTWLRGDRTSVQLDPADPKLSSKVCDAFEYAIAPAARSAAAGPPHR